MNKHDLCVILLFCICVAIDDSMTLKVKDKSTIAPTNNIVEQFSELLLLVYRAWACKERKLKKKNRP
jgi:hypothetical protein